MKNNIKDTAVTAMEALINTNICRSLSKNTDIAPIKKAILHVEN
ncbi:MAG TPA: hypothetical protein PL076_05570 [Bacillota bacterium]|nr:hypothetical protein [Bacillota bacterium]HOS69552.1 hypothetical protein [Bacillota bacterium]HPW39931.1 hypothetical protein [Bacillota bacterium]HQI16766.1 hypothetical protein [Bacillota bacterium]